MIVHMNSCEYCFRWHKMNRNDAEVMMVMCVPFLPLTVAFLALESGGRNKCGVQKLNKRQYRVGGGGLA